MQVGGAAAAAAANTRATSTDTAAVTAAAAVEVGQFFFRVGASLVVDGCDNFATRLTVSDACVELKIPLHKNHTL